MHPQIRARPNQQVDIQAGHYTIAAVARRGGMGVLLGKRQVSRTGTNTGKLESRKEKTRAKARFRDMGCRVSTQSAPIGSRGYNFTGLEVAHIFPLAVTSQFPEAFPHQEHENEPYRPLKIPKTPKKHDIDIPENTLRMRADVHAQFDGYEFAFETSIDSRVPAVAIMDV
ncbi:hypothetical protein DFH09DRAFT_1347488 [Mycena vulgaris]|nr:hypothetical protein DFH09DRAFT_1347488 [Mycena vulgaris]